MYTSSAPGELPHIAVPWLSLAAQTTTEICKVVGIIFRKKQNKKQSRDVLLYALVKKKKEKGAARSKGCCSKYGDNKQGIICILQLERGSKRLWSVAKLLRRPCSLGGQASYSSTHISHLCSDLVSVFSSCSCLLSVEDLRRWREILDWYALD